jgi:putative ABC transport system permease protein
VLPLLLALAAFALTQLPPLFELPLAGYASVALVLVVGIASAQLLTQLLFGWLSAKPGAVVISRQDYQQLGGDFQPTDLALWPLPGHEAQASAWLAPWADRYGLEIADSATIRRLSLSIFDKSFAVTYALEAAATLIGLFGLAVTLAASVWLRARELATLGALGFDRRMLSHAVMVEGALIAAVGLLIGMACGVAIGSILTHVVNPQAFHWRMALAIPWTAVCAGAAITLAAAVLASRYAARQATRLPVAQVLANAQ